MTVRNLLLLAGLSASLIGCVAYPPPYYAGGYNNQYDNDYYDYRDTPSYQGYYYARIIFIGSIPYYVDGDRQIHQIPPRYRDHFSRYPYQNLHRPPVFSRDKEVRDGYPMSRIIYLNGVPYNVGDNRAAQPLPNNLRQRFRYTPPSQGNAPRNDNRPPFPNSGDRNNAPPAFGPARGGNEQPGDGQNRERMDRPPFGGDRQGSPKKDAP
jgi:hypothetical protein